jgi:hypothetical protein
MKSIPLIIGIWFLANVANGQAQSGTVEYNKRQVPAAFIELAAAPEAVTKIVAEQLSKKQLTKAAEVKGFLVYRSSLPMQGDSTQADLFFRVERKSRKEKELTLVSLLLTTQQDGVAGNKVRYLSMDEAKAYLDDLMPIIAAANLELAIKDQQAFISKAESRLKSLGDDTIDLEKKKTGLEKRIEENKQDIQTQATAVEAQKQKLADLISQRKS